MRIALVDDDDNELATLAGMLCAQLGNGCTVDRFRSGEEFLRSWHRGAYELVVLDIFMGGMPGVAVAKQIRESDPAVCLVFCTTSNEYAAESYEVDARYYLRKPVTADKVNLMLDRLRLHELELARAVTLPDGQSVPLRSILYADYLGRSLTLHLKNEGKLVTRLLFSQAEALFLAYPYFCVCSKGMLVNFYEVASIRGDVFVMNDGSHVPISRRKIREVTEAYTAFRFEALRREGER